MNMKIRLLLVALLSMAGCEAIDWNQILGGLGVSRIHVVAATYGLNCGAPQGNATSHITQMCSSAITKCDYLIDVNALGDPKPGCAKAFEVQFQCSGGATQTVSAPAEANTRTVTLQCTL
jgi:hypothetical protein